jgi:hypothetical protein
MIGILIIDHTPQRTGLQHGRPRERAFRPELPYFSAFFACKLPMFGGPGLPSTPAASDQNIFNSGLIVSLLLAASTPRW